MSRAPRRTRCLWLMAAVAALVLASPDPIGAQSRAEERAISAVCTVTDVFPLPTGADTLPVMVTYMTNSRRPVDDVQTKLPKDRLRRGFARDGEFNSIWGPKGVELALVGFRTCSYTLGSAFESDPPRRDVPSPDASFDSVFLGVLRDHNTRKIKSGSTEVDFRGLDVYLWWDIVDYPGYGVRPRFGRQHELLGRGGDEPSLGRPGAIWMDAECVASPDRPVTPDSCTGILAHEVGHFLGLCHCCHLATESPRCINGLRLDYCPGLGHRAPQRVSCAPDDIKKRLMSATNPHTDPARFELLECEVTTAKEGAAKVREFGSNGISNPRGR